MSYEEEIAYLRKEFKKSEDKFREAEREGYQTDADIWQNDMVNTEHQIHIHEQAAKADEYEAKAKAWDKLSVSIRECNKENEVKRGLDAIVRVSQKGQIVQRHIDDYESGDHS